MMMEWREEEWDLIEEDGRGAKFFARREILDVLQNDV